MPFVSVLPFTGKFSMDMIKPPLSSVSSLHCHQWCSRLHELCSALPLAPAQRKWSPKSFQVSVLENIHTDLYTFLQSSKLEMKDSSSTAPAAPPKENSVLNIMLNKEPPRTQVLVEGLLIFEGLLSSLTVSIWVLINLPQQRPRIVGSDLCLNASHLELFALRFHPFFPQLHSS